MEKKKDFNTKWDKKVGAWWLIAHHEPMNNIAKQVDRTERTIRSWKKELYALAPSLVKTLPPEVQAFWKEKTGKELILLNEIPTPVQKKLEEHYEELAKGAQALYYYEKLLLNNPKTSIFSELFPSDSSKFFVTSIAGVVFNPPLYFVEHFRQEFPELDLKYWTELMPEKVIAHLKYLANTAKFQYCPECEACKDLMV
jgi:hypothetical protein